MEDENADRVYVPGTNGTPPDRDVEPFWPPEELSAPVHGGGPVPRDAPPAFPLPPAPPVSVPQQGDPVVYRPADRPVPPQPAPPVYHQQAPAPPPRPLPTGNPDGPAQPWPNLAPRHAAESSHFSGSAHVSPAPPASDDEATIGLSAAPAPEDGAAGGSPAAPISAAPISTAPISTAPISTAPAAAASDSPWAQPPQRPAPAQPTADGGPVPEQRTGAEGAEPRTTAIVPSLGAAYYPAVTPRQSPESGDAQHQGAVYRPGPVGPNGVQPPPHPQSQGAPGPAVPQQRGPQQPGPQPGPQHAGPAHTGTPPGPAAPQPQQPGPPQPGPPQPGPPPHHRGQPAPGPVAPLPQWAANGQPAPPGPYPPAPPGPYPPAVDPRAAGPHPQAPPAPGPQQLPPPADPYQQQPWVSDGTPTAEEFARRRLAKPAEPTATMGARAMLQKGTMGLVRLAPGKREQEYKQDVEMVRRNFGGLRQVTVVNPKGGAGKTVAVLLLAMTFGQKRGGYVLAWDNNETQGTLGMRAQQDFHARTVRDMMRDLQLFRGSHGRVGDLSQYVRAQGEGMFDVLASDESATAGEMLTAGAFAEIREIVSRFYKLIFVDTGNNVRAQNWQAAMDATDQLVITMSARNDSAETAARMLDHLEQSGRQRLVRQAVSVVTMPPTRKDIDLPAIQRHFAARTRAVLLAPYEKLIDSGEPLRYGQLSAGSRDSWLKIAAAVAEGL
ncbi:chromosome partitioning protein [Actinoplanes sp. NPDC049668]|uniref:chromosome partitioning protein n=1 Tax=unclassified Actinoplanes TaxID=2626549 RepID=UPI0033B83140